MRSPHLHDTLRRFCLGAFAVFERELENGADLPFAFEEHGSLRPADALRVPAARARLRRGAGRAALRAASTSRTRVADLQREPAARDLRACARGQTCETSGARSTAASSCRCSSAPPRAAAASTGTTARSRAHTRSSRTRCSATGTRTAPSRRWSASPSARRSSSATASASAPRPPASSRRCGPKRQASCRGTSAASPTGSACSSSSARCPSGAAEAPDAPGELADAVTAIRLATAAPVAAGPVLFERLDWRPYGIRPVLPIAATAAARRADAARPVPRLGGGRPARAPRRRGRRPRSSATRSTAGSSRSSSPSRSAASSCAHALEAALGEDDGAWAAAMRGAALLGATADGARRARRAAARADAASRPAPARRRPPPRRPGGARARARRGAARRHGRGRASPAARQLAGTDTSRAAAYLRGMDEARAVLARLERIEALEREGGGEPRSLQELRELVARGGRLGRAGARSRALRGGAALAAADDPIRAHMMLTKRRYGASLPAAASIE